MPDFDTRTPQEERKKPLGVRIALIASKLRALLIASKPRNHALLRISRTSEDLFAQPLSQPCQRPLRLLRLLRGFVRYALASPFSWPMCAAISAKPRPMYLAASVSVRGRGSVIP
jgi:hypothetical protein